jgi:hypothetical protein
MARPAPTTLGKQIAEVAQKHVDLNEQREQLAESLAEHLLEHPGVRQFIDRDEEQAKVVALQLVSALEQHVFNREFVARQQAQLEAETEAAQAQFEAERDTRTAEEYERDIKEARKAAGLDPETGEPVEVSEAAAQLAP